MPDIESFIAMELASRLENRSLTLGDPSIIWEIQDALLADSKGMFLWVVLQINSLCTLHTDEQIRDALQHLPEDLSEMYSRLLKANHDFKTSHYQRRILELIKAAQRPLTIDEIREALSVRHGDPIWKPENLVNDVYSTLSTCGCLVVVEEEELTVRFVHPTVGQYLTERYKDRNGRIVTNLGCHSSMLATIVTYLNYEVIGTDVSTFRVPELNVSEAPARIIRSTVSSSTTAQSLALKLLKLRKRSGFDMGKSLTEELMTGKQVEALKYHFQHYARAYIIDHITKIQKLDPVIEKLLIGLLDRGSRSPSSEIDFGHVWEAIIEANNPSIAIRLARAEGAPPMEYIELPSYPTYNPVSLAICRGQELMTPFLSDFSSSVAGFSKLSSLWPVCSWDYFGKLDEGENRQYCQGGGNHVCLSGTGFVERMGFILPSQPPIGWDDSPF